MKKVVSIMLAIVMVLSFMTTAMAAPVSTVLERTSVVNVVGQVEKVDEVVSVLLKEGDDVKYINEFPVDEDGNYRAIFKYSGDITGKTIQVRQGSEDVTDSVVSAIAENEAVTYTLDVVNSPVNTEVIAQIENYYNSVNGKAYTVVVAYYGENNRLQNVIINDKNVEAGLSIFKEDFKYPDDAKTIKVFMWDSTKTMIPLDESVEGEKNDTIRILAFGNSHTIDAFAYLPEIMEQNGYNFIYRNAAINGGSFTTHYNAMMNKSEAYKINGVGHTMDDFLCDGTRYDYVVITNIIDYSNTNENFVKYSAELARYIREKQPTAEIIIHQTWAYEENSPDAKFAELYNKDRAAMNASMKAKNEYLSQYLAGIYTSDGKPISLDGKPLRYIPSGDAMWNAGQNELFQTSHSGITYDAGHWNAPEVTDEKGGQYTTLYIDSFHASYHHGRYLVALTWYAALTGESVLDNTYTNSRYKINETTRSVINKAAQDAVDATGIWN